MLTRFFVAYGLDTGHAEGYRSAVLMHLNVPAGTAGHDAKTCDGPTDRPGPHQGRDARPLMRLRFGHPIT